jgi:hypothetical protein
MARPARLELATLCLEGRRSIQLSYGRVADSDSRAGAACQDTFLSQMRSAQGSGERTAALTPDIPLACKRAVPYQIHRDC